jgi:hypothetical protein
VSNNLPERRATGSEIVFYQTEDGRGRIEVRLEDNTVWLTQRLMADLFQTTVANVNIHLKNIFTEGEVDEGSAIKEYLITAADGELNAEATRKEYLQVQQETGRSVERI